MSEYQKEINILDKEIKEDEIIINNQLNQMMNNIENQNIISNIQTENNFKPSFFDLYYNQNKTNYIPKIDKILNNKNNKIIKNFKKLNNLPNGITKSEPNLYRSKSIDATKKIITKPNDKNFCEDFSNISEIKKTDFSFEGEDINTDSNLDYFSQDNTKILDNESKILYDFYNNFKLSKENEDVSYKKKMEIKKIFDEYPELIYNELYKNFSKYQNLQKENNNLKNKVKKLIYEIKEKNKLINEFTELFKQSRLKFEKLILKNKKNMQEIENKNNNEINQLNEKIKKLEQENNILNNRNKKLINYIKKYQKYIKTIEEKYSRINNKNNDNNENHKNCNLFNEPINKINNLKYNMITSRESSSFLNSRINKYYNQYSNEIKTIFENKENITDDIIIKKKLNTYTLNTQQNRNGYNNLKKNVLKIKNISKAGIESNIRKEKAIFRDLSANIEKKISKDIERKRGNSVRIIKSSIN